jgi:hypothetical protein
MRTYPDDCPEPEELRKAMRAMALLDTVLCRRPELRYHRYLANPAPGVEVGLVETGGGDELVCVLSAEHGCLIKGFDHESEMSPYQQADEEPWPGVCDEVPPELMDLLQKVDSHPTGVTFCLWRGSDDEEWWQGDVEFPEDGDDGASYLLGTIFLDADSYMDWASSYYSKEVPEGPVRRVYRTGTIDRATALELNPRVDLAMLERELAAMGLHGIDPADAAGPR